MIKRKKQSIQDVVLLVVSIGFAVFITKAGTAHQFVLSLGELTYLGIFIVGIFFTSVFTVAPSAVILGDFAQSIPLLNIAVIGGLGAVFGDYVIFRFVRDRVAEDLAFLLSPSEKKRISKISKTRFARFFVPLIGALIIAAPLPDEMGIAILGMSKMSDKIFLPLSFILNGAGILLISWIAVNIYA